MRFLMLMILTLFTAAAFARPCEVYGISDSPQKLTCSFGELKISLRCINGTYFLNSSKVTDAFHLDVEYGSVPLVFEAQDMKMTVVIEPKIDIEADLRRKGKTLSGTCL